jgi:hypothetical protein
MNILSGNYQQVAGGQNTNAECEDAISGIIKALKEQNNEALKVNKEGAKKYCQPSKLEPFQSLFYEEDTK